MKTISRFFLISLLVIALCSPSQGQATGKLPRSTPEAEGVSSKGIIDFVNAIDTGKVEIHSFMFVRHGKVIGEGWWNPYGPELKHIMFSASKTFTATGIGLAVSENRLSLNDKVISFFPASLPDTISENMKAMTVRDLLMMSTGQAEEPRRGINDDWIRSFLAKEPADKPGTIFRYNNTATFMLSSIVQQVTGLTLFDYLQPRIFHPLNIHEIDWDMNPQGINLGMIGLRLHTEDMAKFGQLLLQKGVWNGKALIPEAWVKEATSFKIKSQGGNEKTPAELNDWTQGYCYQMWRGRNNSVRLDGMAGQFVILLPDKDAIVVLTANASNTQKEMDLVWSYLLPAIKDYKLLAAAPALNEELGKRLAGLSIKPFPSRPVESPAVETPYASRISGKTVEFPANNYGIQSLTMKFTNDICELTLKRDNAAYRIKAGYFSWKYSSTSLTSLLYAPRTPASKSIDANYKILQPVIRVAASYNWNDKNTLELTARFVEESLASEGLVLKFTEEDGAVMVSFERKGAGGRGPVIGPGQQNPPAAIKGKLLE